MSTGIVAPFPLPPLTFATPREYGDRVGDAEFWGPYVATALARHGLPALPPAVGAVGTFPTFLVGRYVVKFFGELFGGPSCYEIERSLHRVLLAHPEIPAPTLVAEGELFGEGWPWPYLVTTRLTGTTWHDAALQPAEHADLAHQLGRVIRRVHELPPPTGPGWNRDRLADLRAGCVERHRRWGTLPAHLVEQIDRFLVEPSPVRRLIHADLHEHHLFLDGARLVGIVDWGDALLADPYYELPALHLHTFGRSKRLLELFLEGYGWEVGADFARRAMSMTLLHEFNPLGGWGTPIDVSGVATLAELAELLWEVDAAPPRLAC